MRMQNSLKTTPPSNVTEEAAYACALSYAGALAVPGLVAAIRSAGSFAAFAHGGVPLEPRLARWQKAAREGFADARKHLRDLDERGVSVLSCTDTLYPPALGELRDAPILLYARGDMSLLTLPSIAVVGSRALSAYGEQVIHAIVGPMVAQGLVILSGLALGTDLCAHACAVSRRGKTIGITGSGILNVYPASAKSRIEPWIVQGDALILSENIPQADAQPFHFPVRNRLISCLSRGVVIIEAKTKSGTLITARHAAEQGRPVFAVPGSIFSAGSEGIVTLLRDGAIPIQSAHDILDELGFGATTRAASVHFPEGLEQLGALLSRDAYSLDELSLSLSVPSLTLSSILSELEITGVVSLRSDGRWVAGTNMVV